MSSTPNVIIVVGDLPSWDKAEALVHDADPSLEFERAESIRLARAAGVWDLARAVRHFAKNPCGARCTPGAAVTTPAFSLRCRVLIHTVAPVGPGCDETLLRWAYRSALLQAIRCKASSVAFPALATGEKGVDPEASARAGIEEAVDALGRHNCVQEIQFVLRDKDIKATFERELARYTNEL